VEARSRLAGMGYRTSSSDQEFRLPDKPGAWSVTDHKGVSQSHSQKWPFNIAGSSLPSTFLPSSSFAVAPRWQWLHPVMLCRGKGTAIPGKITLLPGQAPAELFSTCIHELAHCCLHQTARRAETTKRIRETEAEAVAFVVCSAIGLRTGTASQDYVGLYGGDAKLLTESLEYVQQTANRILTAVAPENSATPA
jgi:hypothetical protein